MFSISFIDANMPATIASASTKRKVCYNRLQVRMLSLSQLIAFNPYIALIFFLKLSPCRMNVYIHFKYNSLLMMLRKK